MWTVHDNKNIKRVWAAKSSHPISTTRTVEYHRTRTARVGRNTLIDSTPLIEALYIISTRNIIFVASFEIFGYLTERLTACTCSLLIGAHGAHSIRRCRASGACHAKYIGPLAATVRRLRHASRFVVRPAKAVPESAESTGLGYLASHYPLQR